MTENDLYRKAEKRADEKIGFYKHLLNVCSVPGTDSALKIQR